MHPLNIQAVTYIVQRMTSLAALFGLRALTLYIHGRRAVTRSARSRAASFAGAAVSLLLAFGSKENSITVVPVALLYELCFHGEAWRRRIAAAWRSGVWQKRVIVAVPALAVVGALWFASSKLDWGLLPLRDFTGVEHVLTQARVQFLYLGLLLFPAPSRFSVEHEVAISHSLLDPWTTVPAVIVLVGGVVVCMLLASRVARPHALLGWSMDPSKGWNAERRSLRCLSTRVAAVLPCCRVAVDRGQSE